MQHAASKQAIRLDSSKYKTSERSYSKQEE